MPKPVRSPSHSDVEVFDPPFRFWVKSRTSGKRYLCDISAYRGNGKCSCPDFGIRFEPYLAKGHNAVDALQAEVVDLREFHIFEEQALQCFHLCQAHAYAHALTIEKEVGSQPKDRA